MNTMKPLVSAKKVCGRKFCTRQFTERNHINSVPGLSGRFRPLNPRAIALSRYFSCSKADVYAIAPGHKVRLPRDNLYLCRDEWRNDIYSFLLP